MKIINPLYDNAFKYLMDNEQIARKVLSIILEQNVVALQSKPQEIAVNTDHYSGIARYDFKAVIRTANGEDSTVLIELQKYKSPNPIVRFREYLAENYKKEETIINSQGEEVKQALPIVTIYILGYKITQAEILALKVERTLKDLIWNEIVPEKPEFVELLTHTSVILQVSAQPAKTKNSQLERFISLFSQKLRYEDPNYIIDFDTESESELPEEGVLDEIVNYLNLATLDEKVIRSLKYEASFEEGMKAIEKELAESREILQQAEAKAIEAEAKAIEAETKAQREKEEREQAEAKAIEAEAKAIEAETKAIEAETKAEHERIERNNAVNKLRLIVLRQIQKGMSVEDIAEMLDVPISEIEAMIRE